MENPRPQSRPTLPLFEWPVQYGRTAICLDVRQTFWVRCDTPTRASGTIRRAKCRLCSATCCASPAAAVSGPWKFRPSTQSGFMAATRFYSGIGLNRDRLDVLYAIPDLRGERRGRFCHRCSCKLSIRDTRLSLDFSFFGRWATIRSC